MSTERDPQRADLYPTGSGRTELQHHGLCAGGSDLLAWPEPHDLLVGESDQDLFEVPAGKVYAVKWRRTDDHADYDHTAVALGLAPDEFRSQSISLWFDPGHVGLQGIDLNVPHPALWHGDWLHVQGTQDSMVSFPRDWVVTA